jgi:hypothetical protein
MKRLAIISAALTVAAFVSFWNAASPYDERLFKFNDEQWRLIGFAFALLAVASFWRSRRG